MKKIFFICLLGVTSSFGFAEDSLNELALFDGLSNTSEFKGFSDAPCTDADCLTRQYSYLQELYAKGTVPTPDSLVGWFSGRCYLVATPAIARNIVFTGWSEPTTSIDGPLFPGKESFKGMWAWKSDKPANYFDQATQLVLDEIEKFFQTNKASATEFSVEEGALVHGLINQAIKWHIREFENYKIMERHESNGVTAYCYLFNKLK